MVQLLVAENSTKIAFSAPPSVLWHCWLGSRKGIWSVKNWEVG